MNRVNKNGMHPVSVDNNQIILKEGIDVKFFNLLYNLYNPLLSRSHLKDRFKFTIYIKKVKYPVGIISINKGKNTFMQFALIPEVKGQNYAQISLNEIIKISKVTRVDWGCKKINYPSLKILYDFGGGLFDSVVKNSNRKSYEGFFRVGKSVSENMRKNLEGILPESLKLFKEWLIEYESRKKELDQLNEYLKEHSE